MTRPFDSSGNYMFVTLNYEHDNEHKVIVCRNPNDNGDTALLEYSNGDVLVVRWEEITFARDPKHNE